MANAYKQAGVDIEAGYEAVSRMKKHVARTMRPEVMGGLGGFGGLFDLSSINVQQPVLVSGTDGVGTKLMLAFQLNKHDTIGVDAVAMCVNDIVVQGAEPLFFLDYIACGKAAPDQIEQIIKGIADGCEQAGCALIGGETAEMPGMYNQEEYDLAGFTVGVVEKSKLITGENIQAGNVLIGLPSSGIHSNGYSLVRKIIADSDLDLTQKLENTNQTLGEILLTPTKIYVKTILEVLKKYDIKGMAHITGGGFVENIPRMLPKGLQAEVDYGSWPIPTVFDMLQTYGNLQKEEMFNIFNMGIGMVLSIDPQDVTGVISTLEKSGETPYIIGRVKQGEGITFGGGELR
ncbi:phosphoribosylformylglycinamidine cyclo-ligase [Bacillus sp. FJAT-45066]|uniref:phosphoribosylformylglycinamidine cyclo-ligase n=1 Tax=Bacillus sp. FJAT-45066 TaxID=2011010 RepID=UPI000BB8455C|nr:phosphoribosylformylglycinamidine cyclo-ligase [Bacillus sp. FJAT-45066]